MLKSKNDTNDYETFVLDNDLRVFLVEDKEASHSAVMLRVNVGNFHDPKDISGLAHLTEHMLFNGTEKYTEENHFSQIVSKNNGHTNAYTSETATCYYYTVSPEMLDKSLEIFCNFFVNPLLDENSIEREINAVNSEYEKNLFIDSIIEHRLFQMCCDENHENRNFDCGNKETLNIPNIAQRVREFYDKYYSSHIMTLVVVAKDKEKIKNTIKHNFEMIKKKEIQESLIKNKPYFTKSKCLMFCPIRDKHFFELTWNLPSYYKNVNFYPLGFISHILDYKGHNSLHSHLYEKKYIESLTSSVCHNHDYDYCTFSITINLSQNSDVNYIMNSIFEYIKLILNNINTENIKKIYEDEIHLSKFNNNNYIKSSPEDLCIKIATLYNSFEIDANEILIIDSLHESYDNIKSNLEECLNNMLQCNYVLILGSKDYSDIATEQLDYYDVKYKIIEGKYNNQNFNFNFDFKMIQPNKYLSFGETLFDGKIKQDLENIINSEFVNINSYFTNKYKTPDCYLQTTLCFENLDFNLNEEIFAQFYIYNIKTIANKYLFEMECANYKINISFTCMESKLHICIFGNYEKFELVLKEIINIIKTSELSEDIFNIKKNEIIKKIKNDNMYESPHNKIRNCFLISSIKNYKDENAILQIYENIKFEDLIAIKNKLFTTGKIKSLFSGNFNKTLSKNIANIIYNIFNEKHFDKEIFYKLPEIKDKVKKFKIENQKELNNCSVNCVNIYNCDYIKNHNDFIYNYVLLKVLDSLISPIFFDTLRTKECYGYIVNSNYIFRNDNIKDIQLYYKFLVQSSCKDNDNIKDRINQFIIDFLDILINIEDEEIKNICDSQIFEIQAPFQNLQQESKYYYNNIYNNKFIDRKNIEIKHFKNISKQDIITFYKDKFINRKSYFVCLEKTDS